MSEARSQFRRFPRVRTENAVHIQRLAPEGLEAAAKTKSLGAGGCQFEARQPVGEGSLVDLIISVRQKEVITVRARVVYEHASANGLYETGAEFIGLSDEDHRAIDDLLEASEPGGPDA